MDVMDVMAAMAVRQRVRNRPIVAISPTVANVPRVATASVVPC